MLIAASVELNITVVLFGLKCCFENLDAQGNELYDEQRPI